LVTTKKPNLIDIRLISFQLSSKQVIMLTSITINNEKNISLITQMQHCTIHFKEFKIPNPVCLMSRAVPFDGGGSAVVALGKFLSP